MTSLRRVVTGERDGKSVFVSDEQIQGVAPAALRGLEMHAIWGSDSLPTFPNSGGRQATTGWFAPSGGYRFILFTIPPDAEARSHPGHPDPDPAVGGAEVEAAFPGLLGHLDPAEPGMHATPTVDLEIVLAGRITLELSDGVTKSFGPGDTIVQNGTRHRWSNAGTEPAVVGCVFVGARPEE